MFTMVLYLILLAGGLAGSFWIARNRSGARGWRMLLAWLCLPVLLFTLWFVFQMATGNVDENAFREETMVMLTFFLLAFVALPWFLANLIGAFVGRSHRRRAEQASEIVM